MQQDLCKQTDVAVATHSSLALGNKMTDEITVKPAHYIQPLHAKGILSCKKTAAKRGLFYAMKPFCSNTVIFSSRRVRILSGLTPDGKYTNLTLQIEARGQVVAEKQMLLFSCGRPLLKICF